MTANMKNLLYAFLLLIPLITSPKPYHVSPALVYAGEAIQASHAQSPIEPAGTPISQNHATGTVVEAYISQQAQILGVSSTDALFIVSHESQDGVHMRGDDGQSRGYWMISSIWHPEISDACADDLVCSTDWSLHWILQGHIDQWTTWRERCALYPYDNPPGC